MHIALGRAEGLFPTGTAVNLCVGEYPGDIGLRCNFL